jgi:hypothetical protein
MIVDDARQPELVDESRWHQELAVWQARDPLVRGGNGFGYLKFEQYSRVATARVAVDRSIEQPHATVVTLSQVRATRFAKAIAQNLGRMHRRVV